jgi:thiol-disulfide isomerase/thioredoxin
VRYRGGVILLAVCFCLAGCSLFGKKSGTPAAKGPSTDPPPPQLNSTTRDPTPANTVSNSGVVAGQILDGYNHRPAGMYIRVVNLEDIREPRAAPIEVQANEQGYFTITGLRPGVQYQLIARGQDGQRTLAGSLVAKPPNPRLTIWVSEDTTPPAGSPAAQPGAPGRSPEDAHRPIASLDTPIKGPPAAQNPAEPRPAEPATAGNPNAGSPPAAPSPVSPERTAQEDAAVKDGFQRAPAASIPTQQQPKREIAPPPGAPGVTEPPATRQPQQPAPVSREQESVPVPSCQLVGRKLVNLALYDESGRVWEYRKDHAGRGRLGRLVLLDFMMCSCAPCRRATPKLVELYQKYHAWGLEVVAIANESGSIEQQVAQIRGMRGRYVIPYPTLLASGPRCPVLTQFDVHAFPTVILLDENGEIIFRSRDGFSDRDYQEVLFEIDRRLIGRR